MKSILQFFIAFFLLSGHSIFGQPQLQWHSTYHGQLASDHGNNIAVDDKGCSYVTGYTDALSGNKDCIVIKYDANGDTLWVRKYNGVSNGLDEGHMIWVSNITKNVYVTGRSQSNGSNFRLLTIKYDSLGVRKWVALSNGGFDSTDELGQSITTDQFDNVYVGGLMDSGDPVVIKMNTNSGAEIWKKTLDFISEGINILKFNNVGNLVTVQKDYAIIRELDPMNGNTLIEYNSITSGNFATAKALAIDNADNMYLMAEWTSIVNSGEPTRCYTIKYSHGAVNYENWGYSGVSGSNVAIYGVGLMIDDSLNTYSIINRKLNGNFNLFIVKRKSTSSADTIWTREYGTIIDETAIGLVDQNLRHNPDLLISMYNANGNIITVKYNSQGVFQWETTYDCGNNMPDIASDMTADDEGNIYITGYSRCQNTNDDIKTIKYCANPPLAPGPIMGNDSICSGTLISYSVPSDAAAISYTWILPSGWSGTSTTNSIDVVATSSGTLAVVANGVSCPSAATSLFVSVIVSPDSPEQIIGDLTVCSGVDQTYSIEPVAGALVYEWTTPAGWIGTSTTLNWTGIVGTQSGEISVVAVNACGQSEAQLVFAVVTLTPEQPSAINGKDTICLGMPESYAIEQIPNAVYEWTLPGDWFTPDNSQSTINCIPGSSGVVSVVASIGDCVSSAQTMDVVVNMAPTPIQAIVGDVSICSNSSKLYFVEPASNDYTYVWALPPGWSGSSSTNSILVQATTSGTISAKTINDCGESNQVSLSVVVDSSAPVTPVLVSGDTSLCDGANTSLVLNNQDGSEFYHWQFPIGWSVGSESNVLDIAVGSDSGFITVNAYNTCGFSGTLNIPVSVVTLTLEVIQVDSTLIASQQNAEYQWVECPDFLLMPGEINASFTPSLSGSYAVIISDNDCADTSACYPIQITTGAQQILQNSLITLYPNPSNGLFQIRSSISAIGTINIYSPLGRTVYSSENAFLNDYMVDLTALPPGSYIVEFQTDGEIIYKHIVKQ